MRLVDALCLIAAPERFVARATDHAITVEFERNRQLLEQFPDKKLPAQRRTEFEANVRSQAKLVRSSVLSSIGITLTAIAVGVLAGVALERVFGLPSKLALYLLQGAGASIVLGATLSEIGLGIPAEPLFRSVNAFLFRWLYVTGTFLFVVSVAWDAT